MKAKPKKFKVMCLLKPLGLFSINPFHPKKAKGGIKKFPESNKKIDEKYLNETKELLKKLLDENSSANFELSVISILDSEI
ncbi:MAG: hypothetical protein NT084_14585 [Bacteroidetes bacterium]|nr:hypothetical protein [Bacteroidota bacterium]